MKPPPHKPQDKRRLSERQARRIRGKQRREVEAAQGAGGSTDESGGSAAGFNGRVVSHYGRQLEVEALGSGQQPGQRSGEALGSSQQSSRPSYQAGAVFRCHQRANLPAIVTGDLVVWEAGDDGEGVILARGPRHSVFGRGRDISGGGRGKAGSRRAGVGHGKAAGAHGESKRGKAESGHGGAGRSKSMGGRGGAGHSKAAGGNDGADRRGGGEDYADGYSVKPMAANVDRVVVMVAIVPPAFYGLIDRCLVAVEAMGLAPVLAVNKADLMDEGNSPFINDLLALYRSLGYPVHLISAREGTGLAELEAELSGLTVVVVGQSGVGKSSLVNALAGQNSATQATAARLSTAQTTALKATDTAMTTAHQEAADTLAQTGALSGGKTKGTHTTTTARLYHLPHFDLIDSPGIREFGLGHISAADILHGFVEFRPFLDKCKYRNCSHGDEPDCALKQALADGRIRRERFDNCFQILREHGGGS